MNFRRINAIAKKEFIQIWRDPRSLGLALVIPIILIILFGYGLSLDIQNIPMAVWDRDNSKTSRDFIRDFQNSVYFKIVGYYDNYGAIQDLIDKGDVMMGLVIDKDFSQALLSNQPARAQLLLDGSDSNTAQIALGYANAVVMAYNSRIITSAAVKTGNKLNPSAIDLRPRVWFNQDFESKYFIVPGLIAIIMTIIAALLTSLTVAREWERGTMEQLISTPVRPGELIFGKFIPYFIIGMFDLLVSVLMGRFLFAVPLRGNIILLFVMSAIFLTGALSIGIFISVAAKNQLLASQMAILTSFLPAFLLSGFTYEIFNMPKFVQAITFLIPARYFIIILRGIYLKNVGLETLWRPSLLLSIFSVLAVSLAVRKFKKKII